MLDFNPRRFDDFDDPLQGMDPTSEALGGSYRFLIHTLQGLARVTHSNNVSHFLGLADL